METIHQETEKNHPSDAKLLGELMGQIGALLRVVKAARMIFEHDGPVQQTSGDVLRAALLCASSDIETMNNASHLGLGPVPCMVSIRAERRIDLALELADFYDMYGESLETDEAVSS